ncbi:Flagellar protein FliT [Paraliobacillus sp. PM-2]|uniref:hypothetical protein n=1 Tax=Paraliobacillus sp. PM-2 TaxID=1462524 RepID=UPI00061C1BD5|nr:hypothetical protein [Paraliobacillus sp. PM-2]CQR46408.1 Flagellar protein FliT [Paraliobacillus sp. PM-2]
MERMQQLYRLTVELLQVVDQATKVKNREEEMKKVTDLLDQREILLQTIKHPYTEEELAIGKKILPMEQEIGQKMQALFTHLKIDMRTVKKQKTTNQKYSNPYKNLASFDGTFLDKRK